MKKLKILAAGLALLLALECAYCVAAFTDWVPPLSNLRSQFTGRGKNERTYRTTPFGVRLASDQVLQQRQRKARCFTGTGLGASHQVAAFQHRRDRLLLNRGGFTVTLLGNGAQDIRA